MPHSVHLSKNSKLKDVAFCDKLSFAGLPHAIVCHLRVGVPRSTLITGGYSVTGRIRYGKLFNVTPPDRQF